VYFAAERTLLAWLRTGIGVMAFGFVVARFGLVLRLLQPVDSPPSSGVTPWLGAALVALGVMANAAGALQYRHYVRTLPPVDLPSPRATLLPLVFAWTLVIMGTVLVGVLVF
jgi:putative membrane protein